MAVENREFTEHDLEGLQRISDTANVRKRPGVTRSSLGSLLESVASFDPTPPLRRLPGSLPTNFLTCDRKTGLWTERS